MRFFDAMRVMGALIRGFLLAIVLSLLSNIAAAANVHGNIYDLSLNKVSGAGVAVNTTPEQFLVSKDGIYSFDLPNGFYAIKAELRQDGAVASESRNISISREGNYVIDLILFPSFEEEEDISRGPELSFPETSWLGLTVKQQDIFEMVGSGMEYEEIAPKLGNARRTVESIIFQQIAPKMAAVRGNDADSVPHSYLLACSVWNVVVKPYVQSHPKARVFVNSK